MDEVISKAFVLYIEAAEANRHGKSVGIASTADVLETQFVGFGGRLLPWRHLPSGTSMSWHTILITTSSCISARFGFEERPLVAARPGRVLRPGHPTGG